MNFSVLAPEINSARMFAGAGSGPMMAAAAAWNGLADELAAAASSFSSMTSGLASQAWQGPASQAMVAAAAPYTRWLSAAAAGATGTAGQAQAVASAFEAARAATVHPLVVAANRNGLMQLVMSNLFGQNAPAIAAVEAEYEQMWAQDVAAMAGYHAGATAAAAGLAPLQSLHNLATQLAGVLGLPPVTTPFANDPNLMFQTTNFGLFTNTSVADPDEHYVATVFSNPNLTATFTSGFESTLGRGAPGQTLITFQSPVAPLNGGIALPVTDPLAPVFTALLPLGF
jgi:PPE-repeat protein